MGNVCVSSKRAAKGEQNSAEAAALVNRMVATHAVVVFSKSYCPFCTAAKKALSEENLKVTPPTPIEIVELDQRGDGGAIQAALAALTGQRTVPNVFIGGESIGGGDDTVAAQRQGVLKQMLASAASKLAAAGTSSNPVSELGVQPEVEPSTAATATATFAAGCFWGVELYFQRIPGVVSTQVGYTQGSVRSPTYKQVCSGRTGHTEAVQLTFRPSELSYGELVDKYWQRKGFNAAQVNGQGNDRGTQYRSGIYTHDGEQQRVASESKAALEARGKNCNGVEILPATTFYAAEDYHQQYLEKGGQDASKNSKASIRCYG